MKTVALGEIAAFVRGVTFKPADVNNDGVGVMRTKNVQENLDLTDVVRIPARLIKKSSQYLQPGDTLISSANSWNLVGKACWIGELGEPLAIGGFVTALRPDTSEVEPRYLYRWLTSPRARAVLQSYSNKTTSISNLNLKLSARMSVPLPPREEQRRIAGILDQADAIRAKRRQILAHLDTLIQSSFHEMFASESASTTVESATEHMRTGPFGSQLLHSEFVDDGIAVLGLDNVVRNEFIWAKRRYITPGKYEQLKRYTVNPGDVLISIMGTTGRCVVVPDRIPIAITTKHICAITVNKERLEPPFLRACFLWHPASRAHLHRQTKGSIMDGLNMGIIKEMPVPTPPLRKQREFAARVERVNDQRAVVRRALDTDNELFASLQARAFRGEL